MKMQSGVLAAAMFFISPIAFGENDGSNSSGTEKVCVIDTRSDQAFENTLAKCKKGDMIPLENVSHKGILQLCDLTRTVVVIEKYPVGCVYTGKRRKVGE